MRHLFIAIIAFVFAANLGCGPRSERLNGQQTLSEQGATPDWPSLRSPAPAAPSANDVAVIVAIEDYVFLPPVRGARETALDWEVFFRDTLGVPTVFILTDRNATKEAIERTIAKASNSASSAGRLWVVYVGHGAPTEGGDGLLVGVDAQQNFDSLKARSVPQANVLKMVNGSQAQNTIMLVDACFSGRSPDGQLLAQGTQPVIAVRPPAIGGNTVVLTAAKGDELAGALPRTQRPAFSYLALGALRGWAADANGAVSAQAVADYAGAQLRLVTDRTQTPSVFGSSQLVLTQNTRESDPGISRLMTGVIAPASSTAAAAPSPQTREYDSGYGLKMPFTQRWEPQPLKSDDLGDTVATVGRFSHALSDGNLVVQRIDEGDNYFEENLTMLHRAMLQEGAIMVRNESFASGTIREYELPARGAFSIMWYETGSNAMWTIGGAVDIANKSAFRTDVELLVEGVYFD